MLTLSEGKVASAPNSITKTVMEIHLFAKNKGDAPVRLTVQKHATSRSNMTSES